MGRKRSQCRKVALILCSGTSAAFIIQAGPLLRRSLLLPDPHPHYSAHHRQHHHQQQHDNRSHCGYYDYCGRSNTCSVESSARNRRGATILRLSLVAAASSSSPAALRRPTVLMVSPATKNNKRNVVGDEKGGAIPGEEDSAASSGGGSSAVVRLAQQYESKGYAVRHVRSDDDCVKELSAAETSGRMVVGIFDASNAFPLWGVELSRQIGVPYYRYQASAGMFKLVPSSSADEGANAAGLAAADDSVKRSKGGGTAAASRGMPFVGRRTTKAGAAKVRAGAGSPSSTAAVSSSSSSSSFSPSSAASVALAPPLWIDPGSSDTYEAIMEKKGWGFLHADDSEPSRSFDVDSASSLSNFQAPLPWQRGGPGHDDTAAAGNAATGGSGVVIELSGLGYDISSVMTDEQVAVAADAAQLTDLQRRVLLAGGTEPPFQGGTVNGFALKDLKGAAGVYVCAIGGLPLFSSEDMYESGTGWPSFTKPVDPSHVIERPDVIVGGTEVLCCRSGAHLGHVFNDGPQPSGKRYCMNAACFNFIPEGSALPAVSLPIAPPHLSDRADREMSMPSRRTAQSGSSETGFKSGVDATGICGGEYGYNDEVLLGRMISKSLQLKTAYFGGGCFWHAQKMFDMAAGVMDTQAGFGGGTVPNPTYDEVCRGKTGHVELVKVVYRPEVVAFSQLLDLFWSVHDPTTGDRQGANWGPQYQAVLYCEDGDDGQMAQAEELFEAKRVSLGEQGALLQTRLEKLVGPFWPAEAEHQHYLGTNPNQRYRMDV